MDTDDEQINEPAAEEAVTPVSEVTNSDLQPNLEHATEVLPTPIPATATETDPAPIPEEQTSPEPRNEETQPRSSSEELTAGAEIIPTPIPEDTSLPPPIPTPVVTLSPVASVPASPTPAPLPTLDTKPSTFDVSSLSDADLKAAATLYTKRSQAELSKKGVAKRQETMELNLREIVDFLSLNNGSPLPRIAKHTNITLGTTSKYLRQLNAKGKVRAEGWGKTRRYYLK